MPTTDPRIAIAVLASLEAAKISFALLQSPDALLTNEPTGDIDIVVGSSPEIALHRAAQELESRGVHVAILWPYDVAGTATAFIFNTDGTAGAQVDMLYDPKGLGHYAIRSGALLESSIPTEPFPTVAPVELSIYLFSKRSRKRQLGKLGVVKAELDSVPEAESHHAVRRLVTSNRLATQITGRSLRTGPRICRSVSRSKRLVYRLARPVGFWVHCPRDREDLAIELADRFGAVLVRSAAACSPSSTFAAWSWYWRTVQPIRLRPGIVVSWGATPHHLGPRPDFLVDQRDLDTASRNIVAAMSSRFDPP